MTRTGQLDLPLLPPLDSPTVREIQIATRGIDLFDFQNRFRVIEAVSKLYGIDVMVMPAGDRDAREFASQCYEDALVANTAFNPDRGW